LSEKIFEFNGQQLPLTMDIKKWAPEKNIHIDSDYKKAKIYKPNSEATYYGDDYQEMFHFVPAKAGRRGRDGGSRQPSPPPIRSNPTS